MERIEGNDGAARQPGDAAPDVIAPAPGDEPRPPSLLFALKDGNSFVVADSRGDIAGLGDGMFRNDTRVLSRLSLTIAGRNPSLLATNLSRDNVLFTSHMTNRPLPPLGGMSLPEGVIHIERQRLIWNGRLLERITLTNFATHPSTIPLEISFAADFADIFEVRGMTRVKRGRFNPPVVTKSGVGLSYTGLDNETRVSTIAFSEPPASLTAGVATFPIELAREGVHVIFLEISNAPATDVPDVAAYRTARVHARLAMRRIRRRGANISSKHTVFCDWIEKSRNDLALLTTDLPTGPYPYAGIPWFSTPFGRDGIIAAYQILWLDPSLARGVLRYLAANQARDLSTFRDSAPGKIMHETRAGEMARLGEVPFGLYYGGVDTTPLFVILAGAYFDRTGDRETIDEIWPALERAIEWVETFGDSNGDGFVDYQRGQESGLANQGWKDSNDSVFHADGSDPKGPIALVEVQGYAFAAFSAMAKLALIRGQRDQAEKWVGHSDRLRQGTEDAFWNEEDRFYALAVDGDGRPCRVRASNVGHLLFTGLPSSTRAKQVVSELLSPAFTSGWGVRTLATGTARYNPMSYHNGSVWPHDTALCVAGMARYGERDGVLRIMTDIFAAAMRFEMRLPELFCGFPRLGAGDAPVGYPVACMPQAWASGSVFMMLQACLGVTVDHRTGVRIEKPRLPQGVDELEIRNLVVGDQTISLTFQRIGAGVVAYSDHHLGGSVPVSRDA